LTAENAQARSFIFSAASWFGGRDEGLESNGKEDGVRGGKGSMCHAVANAYRSTARLEAEF
jgi:hypothetical protein